MSFIESALNDEKIKELPCTVCPNSELLEFIFSGRRIIAWSIALLSFKLFKTHAIDSTS